MSLATKMRDGLSNLVQKLNPVQESIVSDMGETADTTINYRSVYHYYRNVEVVQRGTNLIVDSAAAISVDVKDKIHGVGLLEEPIRKKKIEILLNYKPNPYQNIDAFRREIFLDLVLEGNAFIYFDGADLYQLPARHVKVIADKKTFINSFEYDNTKFKAEEIIFIKENSSSTIFRGDSRLVSAIHSIGVLTEMLNFQGKFFTNNAVPGLVISTPNILSEKIKNRILLRWMRDYNPARGGKKPLILDGDYKLENLGNTDFRELDFADSIKMHENTILKALGVPPILLDSGNNANISPNLKMFYINTVLPLYDKVLKAMEFYFGYDLKAVTQDILALRPELQEMGNYLSTLTNAGIMTRNESRADLRLPPIEDDENASRLILPANVAGSAQFANEGGRPNNSGDNNENKK
jgi:HK97 family phage portal protein